MWRSQKEELQSSVAPSMVNVDRATPSPPAQQRPAAAAAARVFPEAVLASQLQAQFLIRPLSFPRMLRTWTALSLTVLVRDLPPLLLHSMPFPSFS